MVTLSDHCAKLLQEATLAACAEVMLQAQLPLFSAADFLKPVLDIVYSAFQQYARAQTALQSASSRLPDELLVEVFGHLGVWNRIRAATVCHRWRTVSLDAPGRLWSTIPTPVNLDAWTALLDRARDTPVTLERISLHKRTFPRVSRILRNHIHHVKSLQLFQSSEYDYDSFNSSFSDEDDADLATCLKSILELSAPMLQHISVYEAGPHVYAMPILAAPRLQSVKLNFFPLSCLASCAASSTLRTLIIHGHADAQLSDWPLLSSFPALDVLAVSLVDRSISQLENGQLPLILPQTLRHFRLELPHSIFHAVLDGVIPSLGRVPLWELGFSSSPTLRDVLPALPGPLSRVAFTYVSYLVTFMITERTGAQRIFRTLRPDPTWFQMLSGVEVLCCNFMPEHWFGIPSALYDHSLAFSALRELTFDMSKERSENELDRERDLRWPYGPCPLLHTVRIRAFGYTVRVRLQSVLSVLERILDSDSTPRRKLALLDFDNVAVVADPDNDVHAGLQEFAEMACMRTDGESWPECHRLWNTSWDDLFE